MGRLFRSFNITEGDIELEWIMYVTIANDEEIDPSWNQIKIDKVSLWVGKPEVVCTKLPQREIWNAALTSANLSSLKYAYEKQPFCHDVENILHCWPDEQYKAFSECVSMGLIQINLAYELRFSYYVCRLETKHYLAMYLYEQLDTIHIRTLITAACVGDYPLVKLLLTKKIGQECDLGKWWRLCQYRRILQPDILALLEG